MPKKKTNEQFLKEVCDLVGDEYTFLEEYINATTKIKVKHNTCENVYEVTPNRFLVGRRCPFCSKNARKTNKQFLKEVYDLVGDEYTFLEEYINTDTKIKIIHNECGYEYTISPSSFLRGSQCPKCSNHYKRTDLEFKQEVFDLVEDEYTFLEKFIDTKTSIKVRHNKCGYEYSVTPGNFLQGRRCPNCAILNQRKTNEEFLEQISLLGEDDYTFLEEYKTNKEKILVRHEKCGYMYKVRPNDFLNGYRCPNCNGCMIKSNDIFLEDVYKLVKDEYTFLEPYINNKTKIKVRHNICGYEYEVRPNDFLSKNSKCPKCANNIISKVEKELLDYIKSIFPKEKIIENDRTVLDGKEIDILIPSKNIGFEFDGLYWHNSRFKDKNFHLDKTIATKNKNIQLIHIFEDEWYNKQDLIKKKISHILNCDNSERIFARKCEVRKITNIPDKTKFLNENHIQGSDRCNFAYGLYYKDELVALISFCKPRINMGKKSSKDGEYELSRYATSCNVIGGFGKLLKHCIELEDIKEIYTYADLRWTNIDSNIYLKNGFEYVSTSQPNYWYVINNKREGRFTYQKAKLKELFPKLYSNDKTEEEIMVEAGFYRIYDCGNLKYELKIKKEVDN